MHGLTSRWTATLSAAGALILGVSAALVPSSAAHGSTAMLRPESRAAGLAAYTCGTTRGGSVTTAAQITDVRVGRHASFDRFVIEFRGPRVPSYTVTPKSSAVFWLDPSNLRVTLLGSAGLKVVLHGATGIGSYRGPSDLKPRFPQLREARRLGDFEAVTSWGIGLQHQSCKRVFTLHWPSRLVIDVPH